jgi:hypothetical protein
MLRVLLPALAAAALIGAAPASAACTIPVKAGKRTVCGVAPKAAGAPVAKLPAPKLGKRFTGAHKRKLASRSARKLDRLLDRELRKRATGAVAARARIAAAGDCAGAPEIPRSEAPRMIDGMRTTISGGAWGRAGTPAEGTTVTIEATDGKGLTFGRTERSCVSWDGCPDADGVVRGQYVQVWEERQTVRADGVTATIVKGYRATAELTAHVGDDAKAKGFGYVVDGVMQVRGDVRKDGKVISHAPTRTHRIHATRSGIDRDGGGGSRTAPVARGPQGARMSADEARGLGAIVGLADSFISVTGAERLMEAEHNWYAAMKCLAIELSPAAPEVEPHQKLPVEIRVKAADGSAAAVPYSAMPADGAVGPATGTTPATVTWTAGSELDKGTFPTFTVTSVSKRGRAEATHYAKAAVEAHRFALELVGVSRYDWTHNGEAHRSTGTDSECNSTTVASGFQQVAFSTLPGEDGSAAATADGQVWLAAPRLDAVITQQGSHVTTNSGKLSTCNGTVAWDASGCGSARMPDIYPDFTWEDGRLSIAFEQYRPPGFTCPLVQPEYGDVVEPGLVDGLTADLPLAALRDTGRKEIIVNADVKQLGHEDCDSPDSPGCDAEASYATDAVKSFGWTLVLKRQG